MYGAEYQVVSVASKDVSVFQDLVSQLLFALWASLHGKILLA